ncbi:unnamed protein product [Adineta ricciae]|uniref:Uncharacterized protein n=1 Tax=Adineta ricciae TaxID=249248 RepID=A0A814HW57_ADIRI|nr:unnamed protein product [Adineta ricciae]
MINNNIIVFLTLSLICNTYSIKNREGQMDTDKHHVFKDSLPHYGQHLMMRKLIDAIDTDSDLLEEDQNFDSMNFDREKRFWLFAKNDENDKSADETSASSKQYNSLSQGLWRSGIVGRRR